MAPPPETVAAYWQRKNEELALLRRSLGEDPGPAVQTVDQLVREKLELRAKMVARFVADHPLLTESNLSGRWSMPLDGATLSFSYLRTDLAVRKRPFAPWIYPALSSPRLCSVGVLAAAGMSALAATLTAIDRAPGEKRPLYLAPDTYFETRQLAESWLHRLECRSGLPDALPAGAVVLLDSISERDPLGWLEGRALGPLAAVLLDTSCYDAAAPEIERVVERCLGEGLPCVLLRSHIKLDALGLEYGRLGSIVTVLPRPCGRSASTFAQGLRRGALDFLAKTGAPFAPQSWFPLHSEPVARRLGARRNALMRENNLRAAAALAERIHPRSAARIRGYHHGCFLFLQPPVDDWSMSFAAAARKALADAGVECRSAPSFGYDFLAVTRITGQQYATGGGLRLALPDYPGAVVDRFIEAMAGFASALG